MGERPGEMEPFCRSLVYASASTELLLDLIAPPEHVIDLCEVVSAGSDGRNVALRGVVLLKVGLLAEITHLKSRKDTR